MLTTEAVRAPMVFPNFAVHAHCPPPPPPPPPLQQAVCFECHVKMVDDTTRKAKVKLVTACFIALIFIIGEVIGEGVAIKK